MSDKPDAQDIKRWADESDMVRVIGEIEVLAGRGIAAEAIQSLLKFARLVYATGRNAALEEAASMLEGRVTGPCFGLPEGEAEYVNTASGVYEECAADIRALKETT